jgi:hypothetical protein
VSSAGGASAWIARVPQPHRADVEAYVRRRGPSLPLLATPADARLALLRPLPSAGGLGPAGSRLAAETKGTSVVPGPRATAIATAASLNPRLAMPTAADELPGGSRLLVASDSAALCARDVLNAAACFDDAEARDALPYALRGALFAAHAAGYRELAAVAHAAGYPGGVVVLAGSSGVVGAAGEAAAAAAPAAAAAAAAAGVQPVPRPPAPAPPPPQQQQPRQQQPEVQPPLLQQPQR